MTAAGMAPLIDWLEQRAARVRELESRAREVIETRRDQKGYEALMREKAQLLAGLAEEAGALPDGAGESEAARVRKRLARFSRSASTALEIGSVFFMSALLYPEDHVPGQPNDLDTFIASLRDGAAAR